MWPLYSRFSIFFTVDAGCFARSRFQPSHPEFANQLWGLIAAMDEGLGPIRGWNVDSCSWWRHWWWQGARGGWSLGFLAEMIWKLVYYIKDGHQYRQPFSATRNHRLINMSLWLFVSISVWTTHLSLECGESYASCTQTSIKWSKNEFFQCRTKRQPSKWLIL